MQVIAPTRDDIRYRRFLALTPFGAAAQAAFLALTPFWTAAHAHERSRGHAGLIHYRFKDGRRIRAGDLVPHEWDFRPHPEHQRAVSHAFRFAFPPSLSPVDRSCPHLTVLDRSLMLE
jgi:hypothetical protein